MAVAAIAVGNLRSPALYVASFHAQVFSDSEYSIMVGSQSSPAVKDDASGDWVQSSLMSFSGLVRGQTYYIQAGPVSPSGAANFSRYTVQAGTITVPNCTYAGTYTATVSGVTYDITPGGNTSVVDHYEAIWTKDGSAPSNDSLINMWQGNTLPNGMLHLFVGGSPGQNIHLFMRAVSKDGGYQNWFAVDNRTINQGGGSGSTSAAGIFYADGKSVEDLKPAAAGADVTGQNTAADTEAVNGINAGHISDTATSVGWVGKWWRTSEANPAPVNGGELPYAPMFQTHDGVLNYNVWGYNTWNGTFSPPAAWGPPTNDAQWIYARFTGYFFCSASGTYTFGVNCDDGANLYVNEVKLVDQLLTTSHGTLPNMTYLYSGTITLEAGEVYEMVVEYRNGVNNAGLQVLMTPPGGTIQLVDLGTAYKSAAYAHYTDGTPVDALQPAAAGADVTSVNIPTEMLQNGSFELGLSGWTPAGAAPVIDETQSKYGTKCAKSLGGSASQQVTLYAGHTYVLQFWVKTDGNVVGDNSLGAGMNFGDPAQKLTILRVNGTQVNAGNTNPGVVLPATTATDWTALQMTVLCNATASYGLGFTDCYGTNTPHGNAWFDGITLTDITGHDAPSVGGRPATEIAQTVLAGGGIDYLHSGNVNIPQNANNLLIRGSFEDGSVGTWGGGTHIGGAHADGHGFTQALVCTLRDTFEGGNNFPVSPGQRIYGYAMLDTENIPPGYGTCRFGIAFPGAGYIPFGELSEGLPWTSVSGYITVPAGAAYGVPWLQIDHDPGSLSPTALFYVADMFYSKTAAVDFSESTHINKNANNIPYSDGTTIEALKPAQPGADVTGQNTANNTSNVGSRPAQDVSNTINPGGGIDFNHPGNTNQGDLSKLNQANTQNIVAGAVNSSVAFQSTAYQAVSQGLHVIGQVTLNTNGGYVKVLATLSVSVDVTTFQPAIALYKGDQNGQLLTISSQAFAPNSGGFASVTLMTVDPSPSPSQQYTLTITPLSQTAYCQYISLLAENAKV